MSFGPLCGNGEFLGNSWKLFSSFINYKISLKYDWHILTYEGT